MKKIFLLTALLILGTFATWAQTNALSFTIYPEESGTFIIWYSTKDAPSTNVVEVDWGDGNVIVYNDKSSTGSDPTIAIQGTVNRTIPINIYSNCIEALLISTKVRAIDFWLNNPHLEYFYYFKDNLSSANLEALYMSLPDRNGIGWGELHLSQEENVADAGDNILKSNAFITQKNNWRVCSFAAWSGELYERMHWSLTDALATTHLIPAITFQTKTTANMTDLQIGIMDTPEWPWYVIESFIRVDDGTDNYKSLEVISYDTDRNFEENAPELTIKGTGTTGVVKIYGALVSHFKTNQIRSLNLNNIKNLRYLSTQNSSDLTELLGINQQKHLNFLDLRGNNNLLYLNVNACDELKTLWVGGCRSLSELWFTKTNLELLDIGQCVSLPRKKTSTLSDATKLSQVFAENLDWDACELDAFYDDLRPSPPSPGLISVDDSGYSTPSNDWAGSNKTIATGNGWDVSRWDDIQSEYIQLNGDGGGCITGISQEEAAKFIFVFPNPATDVVNITLVPNLNAESLQVIDVTGITVFSIPVSPSESEYQINISNYAKGIYLIRLGNVTQKLLVK